jgi:hypothetical protein
LNEAAANEEPWPLTKHGKEFFGDLAISRHGYAGQRDGSTFLAIQRYGAKWQELRGSIGENAGMALSPGDDRRSSAGRARRRAKRHRMN